MAAQRKTRDQLAAELEIALAELETLRAANGDVTKGVNDYKERVKAVALRAKTEHDWCEVIDGMLKELDIDPSMPRFRFTLMVPMTMEVSVRRVEKPSVSEEFVLNSLNTGAIEEVLEGLGQDFSDDNSAILDDNWDTYMGGYGSKNSWSIEVGDIEVKDLKQVTG